LDLGLSLVKTEAEGDKVLACMDKSKASDYTQERVQLIKWELLQKIKGSEEAEKFLMENLANFRLRTIAIETAIRDVNLDKAIGIARDGIQADAKDKPGYVYNWYDWLLKIAMIQKDTDRIIEYARLLFVQSNHHDQDYYLLLKKTVIPDRWKAFVEVLITDIQKGSLWYPFDTIAGIFIKEEWWNRLFDLLKTQPSLHRVLRLMKNIWLPDIRVSWLACIQTGFFRYSQEVQREKTTRRYAYLRRMKKLGGNDQCNSLSGR